MPETTFTGPDLMTFLGLNALGMTAVGQHLSPARAIVECRIPIGFEDPFLPLVRRPGDSPRDGGPAPVPRTVRRFGNPCSCWYTCGASPASIAGACGGRT